MRWLDFAELSGAADQFDAAIAHTPAIDRFCSSSAWILPAQAAFCPDATPFITHGPAGFVALMVLELPDGRRVATPLEASWGLASPFAGREPYALVDQLRAMMRRSDAPESLYLSGVARTGPWFDAVLQSFMGAARFGLGRTCGRRVVDLRPGVDHWLSDRSSRFRANLRRADRRCVEAGYRFEWTAVLDPNQGVDLFDALMAVESRSWKGQAKVGVDEGDARTFYRLMTDRLTRGGGLRVLHCHHGDELAAFVFGGVFGDTFRGLQMSYDHRHRNFSLGNVGQYRTMQHLAAEGVARYDLGTEMPYKARWGPSGLETITLAVFPGT